MLTCENKRRTQTSSSKLIKSNAQQKGTQATLLARWIYREFGDVTD
jgi:hypothetical protein